MSEEIGSLFIPDESAMLSFKDKMTWEEFIAIHRPYFPAISSDEVNYSSPDDFYHSFLPESGLDFDWNYVYRFDISSKHDGTREVIFSIIKQRRNLLMTVRVAINKDNYWKLLYFIDACKQYNAKHWR